MICTGPLIDFGYENPISGAVNGLKKRHKAFHIFLEPQKHQVAFNVVLREATYGAAELLERVKIDTYCRNHIGGHGDLVRLTDCNYSAQLLQVVVSD